MRLKNLQNKLDTAADSNSKLEVWNAARTSLHREMRHVITEFIKFQLNSRHVSASQLELDLKRSIEASISNSWAEQPAKVLKFNAHDNSIWVVTFVLDYAAGGAMSVIQVYRKVTGSFVLTLKGGREMNDCDMDILTGMPSYSGEIRLFAYGAFFGANQAVSQGVLYAICEGRLITLWQTKHYLGLSATVKEGRLTLEYRDSDLFYKRVLPDAYRDVYMQTTTGVRRISHTPLPADQQ